MQTYGPTQPSWCIKNIYKIYIDLILREREAQAQTKNLVYAEFRGCGVSFFLFHSHRHQPKNSCCSLLILRAVVFFLLGFLEKLIILVHNSFFSKKRVVFDASITIRPSTSRVP